jgi:arylsulfatase A-like enzyme
VDPIIRVPVVFDGIKTVGDRCSLLDIGPTLASAVDAQVPAKWQGNDLSGTRTEQTITVAPWHESATVAWQDFERKLVARDADVSITDSEGEVMVERTDVSEGVEAQLRDLGYSDAG